MRARQADVAKEAGVSARTVSNVINGYPFIRAETAERVRTAIEKLGYVPNGSARTLRTGRMGTIGLAVPDLALPYFAELATEMTLAAERHGYTILIDVTGGRADRERHVLSGLRPQTIDGLIISPLQLTADEIAHTGEERPVVLLGEWGSDRSPLTYVGLDNVAAAAAATRHLVDLGRRRIAAIGPVRGRTRGAASQRLLGYRKAMAAADLPVDPALVAEVDRFGRVEGMQAMDAMLGLDDPPDAVFCFNDLTAVGVAWAAQEAGLRIPEDVAVMGWDDIPEVRWTRPPISSVRSDIHQIADRALASVLAQIEGRPTEDRRVLVDHHLEIRRSTGGRPHRPDQAELETAWRSRRRGSAGPVPSTTPTGV